MKEHRTAARIVAGLAIVSTMMMGAVPAAQARDTGWDTTKKVKTDRDTGWDTTRDTGWDTT